VAIVLQRLWAICAAPIGILTTIICLLKDFGRFPEEIDIAMYMYVSIAMCNAISQLMPSFSSAILWQAPKASRALFRSK
jgi:hypothetical protein